MIDPLPKKKKKMNLVFICDKSKPDFIHKNVTARIIFSFKLEFHSVVELRG